NPAGMVLASFEAFAKMNTTSNRPLRRLLLSLLFLLTAVSLIRETRLSPVAAGQLEAQIAGMPSMGDAGALEDLYSPDVLFTPGREVSEDPPLAGSAVSSEFEQSLVYAHDPGLESLPDEIADRSNSTGMEAFLASRIDGGQNLEKGRLVADDTGPRVP